MQDIVTKISRKFPSAIDTFAIDIERRKNLTDTAIEKMLTRVFNRIDTQRLSPELSWRYNRIKERI